MDKYEYRVRAEEINALIEKREYAEAVKIADTIDWRRVKSVTMLCKVSELYKMNRRYEDSKEILLLAYDRQPGARKIVYSLCELCIKLEELVQAIEYYKEFVQIAPRDTGRFILQYRLYEAQDVSLEERIAVLEEYKKRDYREKWAYELAYLYHRIGLATRCVEECDELILWFGEGKYVIKAMELKMLHVPLTPTQQEKYDKRFQTSNTAYVVKVPEESEEPAVKAVKEEKKEPIQEPSRPTLPMDTIPSMPIQIKSVEVSNAPTMRIPSKDVNEEAEALEESAGLESEQEEISIDMPEIPLAKIPDDLDIHVKTMDMGEYNTINLQKELAKNLAEVMQQEDMGASDATKALPVDSINDLTDYSSRREMEEPVEETIPEEMTAEEEPVKGPMDLAVTKAVVNEVVKALGEEKPDTITEEDLLNSLGGYSQEDIQEEELIAAAEEYEKAVQESVREEAVELVEEQPAVIWDEPAAVMGKELEAVQEEPVAYMEEEPAAVWEEPVAYMEEEPAAVQEEPVSYMEERPVAAQEEPVSYMGERFEAVREEPVSYMKEEPVAVQEEPVSYMAEEPVSYMEERPVAVQEESVSYMEERPVTAQEEPISYMEERSVAVQEEPVSYMAERPAAVQEDPVEQEAAPLEPMAGESTEEEMVDDQITGQLSFGDIMAEWEETKRANEARHLEEMKRKVFEQTGPMFKDYDAAAKASVQADLDLIAPSLNVFSKQPEEEIRPDASLLLEEDEEDFAADEAAVEIDEPVMPEMEVSETKAPEQEDFQPLPHDYFPQYTPVEQPQPVEVKETAEELRPVEAEEPMEEPREPEFKPMIFNTAEINGLEEKLLLSTFEQGEEEQPQEEEPQKPGAHTEEFDKSLEKLVLEALAETEKMGQNGEESPVEQPLQVEEPVQVTPFVQPEPPIQAEEPVQAAPFVQPEPPVRAEEPVQTAPFVQPELPVEEPQLQPQIQPQPQSAGPINGNLLKKDTGFIIEDLNEEEEIPLPQKLPVAKRPSFTENVIPIKRMLTRDEKEMFGSIAQTKKVQEEVANAIDNISLNPCLGNVLITGERGTGTLTVAKNLIKVLSIRDDTFSGKVAKIAGDVLNGKSIDETLGNLSNGALIVEQAGKLDDMTLLALNENLKKKRADGILIIFEDTKKELNNLLLKANMPKQFFDLRIDIAALDNNGLVNYGKEYANELEYAIDDMGVLALYTRISDMQTNEHAVTVDEVRDIIDEAIQSAEKKNISHFMDVLLAKRYDDEDMIVLREKDFLK